MAGFANLREVADAQDAGRYLYASWRKQPTQTTASGIWFDLSMSPGNPAPNYYIGSPNIFTPLKQSTDGGIRHGGNVSPRKKYIRKLMAQTVTGTAVPLSCLLLDYIGFYPFIDESITDIQDMDNTTPLPRHADGQRVQMMPIVVAAHSGAPIQFYVIYTNQDGVAGRQSQTVTMGTQLVNGTVLHSMPGGSATFPDVGPFIPLQRGDTGVQSVQQVQILGIGDVGLFALVLVKPLCNFALFGVDAPTEVDYYTDLASMPEILDDAYLNFISLPVGTLAGAPINGILETTFN